MTAVDELVAALSDGLKWSRYDGQVVVVVTEHPNGFDLKLQDGRVLQMRVSLRDPRVKPHKDRRALRDEERARQMRDENDD